MGKLFGTDGVRGVANQDLTAELALKLGWAGALVASKKGKKAKIVVGRDTRLSGDLLESALTAGILSTGADVLKVGVVPTPGIAFLTRDFEADAGVVISASHNPAEDNGIKFFGRDGFKFSDNKEQEVEKLVLSKAISSHAEVGRILALADEAKRRYMDHVLASIDQSDLDFKLAVDCANGAAYEVAPAIFKEVGAKVTAINAEPDGLNINVGCGSTNPECICQFVEENGFDLGLAFDGDADRVVASDAEGKLVDGDIIMAICADYLFRQGKLTKNKVATTIMTNLGFDLAMRERGIDTIKTDVGDRFVLEGMLKEGLNFGGEQSGHIIFLDYNPSGDGLITSLQLLSVMKKEGKSLSELKKIIKRFPQVLVNVRVQNNGRLARAKRIWQEVALFEERLKDRGRILVRSSGTEPLVRVMVEAESKEEADSIAHALAKIIKEELT